MNVAPFFSILIPSYNRPLELKRCIDSILKSSFPDFEIVVSDDNSPRQTEIADILVSFGSLANIKFYMQPSNLKEPDNKNFLVTKATGKYNIVLGDDDTLCEDTLSFLHEYIQVNPGSDIYGFGYQIVDEIGTPLTAHVASETIIIEDIISRLLVLEAGLLPMALFHPATFCCRSGLEMDLPYRTDVGIGEDLCFLLQAIINNYSLAIIPKVLFNWRKVQDIKSVSQGNQSAEFMASFQSKYLIYNLLTSAAIPDARISEYISTVRFRFNFLYVELLRFPNIKYLDCMQFMNEEILDEFLAVRSSLYWRLNLFLIKPVRLFDLVRLVGFFQALKIISKRYLLS